MEVSEYQLKNLIRKSIIEVFQENQTTIFSLIDNYYKERKSNIYKIYLASTSEYPCAFDDLIDKKTKETIITISTKNEVGVDLELGITKSEDKIFDIVVDVELLTKEVVKKQVKKLSKIVEINYLIDFVEKQ